MAQRASPDIPTGSWPEAPCTGIALPSAIPPAGSAGGLPPPSARRLFLNAPIEMRVMFREVTGHPERMQKTMDDMMATWQKAQAEARKKTGN